MKPSSQLTAETQKNKSEVTKGFFFYTMFTKKERKQAWQHIFTNFKGRATCRDSMRQTQSSELYHQLTLV